MNPKEILEEINKCKNSPYYFATTYLTVKSKINGEEKPYFTNLTEEEFNKDILKYQNNESIDYPKTRYQYYQVWKVSPKGSIKIQPTEFIYFLKEKADDKMNDLNKEIHLNLTEYEITQSDYYIVKPTHIIN